MKYKMEDLWGRQEARKRYGSEGMCAANKADKLKDGGSDMTHKYPDTAREPKMHMIEMKKSEKE